MMNFEFLKYLAIKARKISLYERHPRTDEEFYNRRMRLLKSYSKAKEKYISTSDKTYLKEMKKIRGRFIYNVSRTEYEACKKLIEEYKAAYKEIDEEFWTYDALICIFYFVDSGTAKTLKEGAEMYRELCDAFVRLVEFEKYLDVESLNELDGDSIDKANEQFLKDKE